MRKAFAIFIIFLAIILASLGLLMPREHLGPIIAITNFFDIMIPILGVGAIINYIWKSCGCCHHHEEKESESSCCSSK